MLNEPIPVKQLFFFLLALIAVLACGLFVDVMDVDAAQYASISREMLQSGNYLEVMNHHHDYLDKPPLLFWLSSFSFSIFGIHNWSYKLPSFLFGLLGIYSTYGIGKLFYSKQTGMMAALILASSLAIFITQNDIRTDTMLIGAVTFAVWQLLLWVKTKRWMNLVLGFAGVGVAMLAKGPLGLMLPVLALSSDFVYKRQWTNFLRWQWLVGLVIIAALLTPMCIGLYRQFDLHPEKVVNGETGVSGLRFYFWTQSFGRLTGESTWGTKYSNGAGPFFFTHTFLWVFLPWTLLFLFGLWKSLVMLVKSRFRAGILPEAATLGGFVLTFIALSASKYKLPHYIYITVPLASVITARYLLHDVLPRVKNTVYNIHRAVLYLIALLLLVVVILALFFVFNTAPRYVIACCAVGVIAAFYFLFRSSRPEQKLLYPLLCMVITAYAAGNLHFYPKLLEYQSTNFAGKKMTEKHVPEGAFAMYHEVFEHSLEYYSQRSLEYIHELPGDLDSMLARNSSVWVYTDPEGKAELEKNGFHSVNGYVLPHYGVQFITIPFLDPRTRETRLRQRWLLEYKK